MSKAKNNLTPAEILEVTADKFESDEWGWIKGSFSELNYGEGPRYGYCLVGGLQEAANVEFGSYNKSPRLRQAIDAVALVLNFDSEAIGSAEVVFDWNDRYVRTKDEVIQTLKLAAKELRNA
jgi:hypothetical protein